MRRRLILKYYKYLSSQKYVMDLEIQPKSVIGMKDLGTPNQICESIMSYPFYLTLGSDRIHGDSHL